MSKTEDQKVYTLFHLQKDSLPGKIRDFIYESVSSVLPDLKETISPHDIFLDYPSNEQFGDYSSNIALILAGRVKQKPRDLAEKIAEKLNSRIGLISQIGPRQDGGQAIGKIVEKVEVAGPGFINIWLRREFVVGFMEKLLGKEFSAEISPLIGYYAGISLSGKKIMVEFAHPNTHKEFHIGHLRNISIGEALVRILEANGGELFRANYEGDVGLHVAKAIFGIREKLEAESGKGKAEKEISIDKNKLEEIRKLKPGKKAKFLGEGYALGSKMYEESEEAKKEIIQLNKDIYKDPKNVELWEETRQWSLDYFEMIYRRLGTRKFDRYFFESAVEEEGRRLVIEGVEKGIFVKDKDGSIYFPGEKYGLNNCVFVTKENYATYEGKDVAVEELEYRTFPFDVDIHVVAYEQKNFFEIAFKALEQIYPHQKNRQYHLPYGMVKLKAGKMSSRTGQVITADFLIDGAKLKVKEIMAKSRNQIKDHFDQKLLKIKGMEIGKEVHYPEMKVFDLDSKKIEEVAEKVAVGAVKYSMLAVNPRMDIAFDMGQSVSFEGDSGPYIQYTYARCKSVLRKAEGVAGGNFTMILKGLKSLKLEQEEEALLRSFLRFPNIVMEAGRMLSPNLVASYLFDLAQKYNLFYNKHSILGKASSNQSSVFSSQQKARLTTDHRELITEFRLALTEATANIIHQGLYLLGIETVERM